MATPKHQTQGSQAWHDYRATRGNASETAALMGASPFYPRSAAELFDVKTGRQTIRENDAMRRGSRLEEPARAYMEGILECPFSPHVCERDRLSASLDGLDFDGTTALEIKVPAKGQVSDTFTHVVAYRTPPDHYWWQVQHQLLCSGAKQCIFAVVAFDEHDEPVTATSCSVTPEEWPQNEIMKAWERFLFEHIDVDERPEAESPKYIATDDPDWTMTAARYRDAKRRESEAKAEADKMKQRLIELAGDTPTCGGGVRLNYIWTQGSIDYKAAVPEGIDLEQYRKEGKWQTRIDLEKNG